jgi:hypothetical protein
LIFGGSGGGGGGALIYELYAVVVRKLSGTISSRSVQQPQYPPRAGQCNNDAATTAKSHPQQQQPLLMAKLPSKIIADSFSGLGKRLHVNP